MKRKHKTRSQRRLEKCLSRATTEQLLEEVFMRAKDRAKFKTGSLPHISAIVDEAEIFPNDLFSVDDLLESVNKADMAKHLEDAGYAVFEPGRHQESEVADWLSLSNYTVIKPGRDTGNGFMTEKAVLFRLKHPGDQQKGAALLDTWNALDPNGLYQAVRISCGGAA